MYAEHVSTLIIFGYYYIMDYLDIFCFRSCFPLDNATTETFSILLKKNRFTISFANRDLVHVARRLMRTIEAQNLDCSSD